MILAVMGRIFQCDRRVRLPVARGLAAPHYRLPAFRVHWSNTLTPLSLTPAAGLHRLRGMCKSRRFLMQHGLIGAERITRPAL